MNRTGDKGGELRVNGVEAADGADGVVRRNAMLAYTGREKAVGQMAATRGRAKARAGTRG